MKAFPYVYTPTEEIVRWAFEVVLKDNVTASKNWFVAFTNPTAGPWKHATAPDSKGLGVEILRFGREQGRPDLVLVSDALRLSVIIEAKDDLTKLITETQMRKSIAVIRDLGRRLKSRTVKVWRTRARYPIVPGFLWAGSNPESEFKLVLSSYDSYVGSQRGKPVIGVCVVKTNGSLVPVVRGRGDRSIDMTQIVQSFGLRK